MRQDAGERRPLIVSPLEFERKALRRAGLYQCAELVCCGPGAKSLRRWFEHADATGLDRPVILAGLAGALSDSIAAGSAWWIESVRTADGRSFAPTLSRPRPGATATITSSATVLTNSHDKRRLADQTKADLVDLESATFAELATKAGRTWAIVRGVSDDARTTVPEGIGRWVNDRGRTSPAPLLRQILLRPGSLPLMMRLGRDGSRAMRAVAELLRQALPSAADH